MKNLVCENRKMNNRSLNRIEETKNNRNYIKMEKGNLKKDIKDKKVKKK